MEEKYKKILALIKENKGKKLTIERKYIPEIIHDDGWQMNSKDGLPELTHLTITTIKYWKISIKYKNGFFLLNIPKDFSLK
ncbi:MAG: hypothetical protein KGD73_02595 [Candidatus Lokiarchaeota archaeon]|nr:hypothetical protein [Candidatus Lokiarchaeota archaeon]